MRLRVLAAEKLLLSGSFQAAEVQFCNRSSSEQKSRKAIRKRCLKFPFQYHWTLVPF